MSQGWDAFESHKKTDLLTDKINTVKEIRKEVKDQLGRLDEAIEDLEMYIEAITEDSEFTVKVD